MGGSEGGVGAAAAVEAAEGSEKLDSHARELDRAKVWSSRVFSQIAAPAELEDLSTGFREGKRREGMWTGHTSTG